MGWVTLGQRPAGDLGGLGGVEPEAAQHASACSLSALFAEFAEQHGVHHRDERASARAQREPGLGDLEAPCRDARAQVSHRGPCEHIVGHAVGDVQAHQQPRPLGLLPGQAHEMAVGDADRLGGILMSCASLHAAQMLGSVS